MAQGWRLRARGGAMSGAASAILHRPPGVSPRSSLRGDLGVAASALLVIGSIPVLPLVLVWLWWRARKAEPDERRRAWTIFAAALASYAFLALVPAVARPGLVRSAAFRWWVEYFTVRIAYRSGEPLPRRQYLFLMMPHGLYPFSGACAVISGMVDVFHGMRMASASIAFHIPVIRQLMAWIGSIPADRASIAAALRAGSSVCVFPGGIGEMVRTDGASERLVLSGRKGVVQLALENGTPIVPVYVFGQTVLWGQLPLPRWVETLSRWLRVSLILPYGRFGTFIPRKLPLLYCVGAPIAAPRTESLAPEQVDAAHRAVIDSVRDLYETYKGIYGWGKRPLFID
uniref:Acyltransferase n=1 Tax=Alexandrium monilatum TaxID=311494 RepID=A0A7S4R5H2_9DINO